MESMDLNTTIRGETALLGTTFQSESPSDAQAPTAPVQQMSKNSAALGGMLISQGLSQGISAFERDHPHFGIGQEVDVTPDPSTMWKFGRVRYTIEEAVAELVDNSVDAISGDAVHIFITFGGTEQNAMGPQFLTIQDDGAGMTANQAITALKIGASEKADKAIGKFGFGLKKAGTFLGRRIVITTATEGAASATVIVYDEEDFRNANDWKVKTYQTTNLFNKGHGTIVRIERLHVNLRGHGQSARIGNTPGDRLERHIARQHRERLGTDVFVALNQKNITATHPAWDLQYEPFFPMKMDFELTNGKAVRGYVGVATAESMNSKGEDYGLDLVRNGRIITKFAKLGFRHHPMHRNIYGVLHLNEFDVTNDKTSFVEDTDEWLELEAAMKEKMKPLIRVLADYYKKGPHGEAFGPGNRENSRFSGDFRLVMGTDDEDGEERPVWGYPGHIFANIGSEKHPHYAWQKVATDEGDEDGQQDPESTDDNVSTTDGKDEEKTPNSSGESSNFDESKDEEDMSLQHDQNTLGNGGPSLPVLIPKGNGQRPGDAEGTVGLRDKRGTSEIPLNPPVLTRGLFTSQAIRTNFEGSVAGVPFRHRVSDDGPDALYQSSDISDGVLEVVTNSGHFLYPVAECPAEQYKKWFFHNIIEAYVENEQATADQFVAMKSDLVTTIVVMPES